VLGPVRADEFDELGADRGEAAADQGAVKKRFGELAEKQVKQAGAHRRCAKQHQRIL